jgi:hypothetical protein
MSRLSLGNVCCSQSLKLLFSGTLLSWEAQILILAFCCLYKYNDETVLNCGFPCWNLACHTKGRKNMQGEDSGLVSCDFVLLGGWCSAFWRNVFSSTSLMSTPGRLTLEGEGTIVFQTSGTTHQRHSVTFQKTWIFSSTTLRTSYLAASREFEKQMLWGVFGCKRKEQWLDEIAEHCSLH